MAMDRPEDELPPFYMEAAQTVVGMPPFPGSSEEATGKAIEAVRQAILKAREDAFEEILTAVEPYTRVSTLHNYGPGGLSREEKAEIRTGTFIFEDIQAIRQHSQKGER